MLHGNIYPADKVPAALAGFFRTENLVALRELALRFVADRVRRVLRLGDLAFRYGGEEFAVLLRKCDAIGGLGVYDRLRDELRKTPVELGRGASKSLSVSAGLATMEVGNNFREGDLVSRADEALYRAKHGGRDKVEMEAPV